mgnify:CR=1 FL=1
MEATRAAEEGEEEGEEDGEEEGEEGGEGLAHRGRLLELELDGVPSGRLEGPLGVVVEVVGLETAWSEGGRKSRAWSG